MAPTTGRNRARDFEKLIKKGPRELDPEQDEVSGSDEELSDEDASQEDNLEDGREHYEVVGKSKLRKTPAVALGPQYRGSKVSRDLVGDDDEEDDPFTKGFDEEDSEIEEGGDGGDEDLEHDDESEDDEDDEDIDAEEFGEEGESSQTDLSDEEAPQSKRFPGDSVKVALQKGLDLAAQKAVTASISQANKEDAEKGRAVKQQQAVFDTLLSARMQLQKSLVSTNTLVGLPSEHKEGEREGADQALQAAETAAFNLWNTLNNFREDLMAARTGSKRKRSTFTTDSSTQDLWKAMQRHDSESKENRDATLRKWSNKSQGVMVQTDRSRLNQTESRATIIDVIQEQLSSTDRLLKRAHTPRSCAPLQVSQRKDEDPRIFDDADFYSLLLKELLERKSQDSATVSNIDIGFQMRREAKTKKNVDTKASKGRKLRYTVHEKLQNFMAPEDRGMWEMRQADELFGSLFGQRLGLGERDDRSDEEMDDHIAPEEAGLMLFRS